ncbi:MAG TPA: aminopeptidase P N-terminal domain-containing protein [Pyrinomonadaceae bacterium]|nr:aminopeptidase P N-terminal domain-containing protein [Pyrinomonadaceae bacterium]
MKPKKSVWILILLLALTVCTASAQEKPSTFRTRRDRVMQAASDALVLVRSRSTVMAENEDGFRQNALFYYLTGLENAVGALLVIDSQRHESWLFVPSSGQLAGFGRFMHSPYAYVDPGPTSGERLDLDHIVEWAEFAPFVDRRLQENSRLVIRGPFSNDKPATTPALLIGQTEERLWETVLRARWPQAQFGSMPDAVALRAIKDANEVEALRRVAVSSSAALRAGLAALRPGRRQRDAEVDVVAACVRAGADAISFWPWLMTGNNSDLTVAVQSWADRRFLDREMRAGELARVDVGCAQDNYEGDVGRTAPVSGRFDAGQREAWDLFIVAYRAGLDAIKPGKTSKDVFATWQREFQRRRAQLRTAFARRTAEVALSKEGEKFWQMHGVGLESAEGFIDNVTVGQVLAFEPILVVDGVGLYLEDMILVTPAGAEVLTTGLPYTSSEIESAMHARK